jgi:glycosyltransferase involved in cell wall biosynthesis
MRILFIVPELCGDGPSRAIAQIAAYVPRDEFDLRVCSLSRASVAYDSLPVVRSLDCDSALDVRTYSRVRALIREWQPDVVHTQLLRPDWYGRTAARAEKVPAICTTVQNEDDVTNRESYGRVAAAIIDAITRRTARAADALVVVSDGVRGYVTRLGMPVREVVHIPNPVDVTAYDPEAHSNAIRELCKLPDDAVVVGALAGLRKQKALHHMIAAAAMLPENIAFVIAGTGAEEARLRELIAEKNLERRFFLIGRHDDVPRFLAGIDIFALSSLWEGMPLALLEAMAAGRPSVVTDIGGCREMIADGVEGRIVPPADAHSLAQGIEQLANDEALRASFGRAARAKVEREFSAAVVAEKYAALWRHLIA